MSSYRNYSPWKSSLPSSYKSSTASSYSSRDDVTSRFSALSSPSSYRPSFSGGTYRIKRDPPSVPASTYVSRYGSSISTALNKSERDTTAREECSGSRTSPLKRYGSTASSLGRYSREASPATLEHTNRLKSRDPSPVNRSLREKSRDSSPALDKKSKIGYAALNSFRSGPSRNTSVTSYSGRYGSNNNKNNTVRASVPIVPDKYISYLSSSDIKARTLSKVNRKSSEKDVEVEQPPIFSSDCKDDQEIEEDEETDASLEEEEEEKEAFITITVVNRATSPNPPGTSTTQRSRRMDIAKTIEKTIQRSTKKNATSDKEIQSDRLDDSTRYSRFGLSGRGSSSYSPHSDRYTSPSLRYSVSPLAIISRSSSNDNKKDENSSSSATTSTTTSASNSNSISNGISNSSGRSTKSPLVKTKLSPPKGLKLNSRQSSVENLSASASKPPVVPKSEYPTKCPGTIASSTPASKLPNKDFRKSALNVGPTDRPRKSRTPSSGTESDAQLNSMEMLNGALQVTQNLERSPSAGSEVSNASSRSTRRTAPDSKLRLRSHNKPNTSSPPSRQNSSINSKQPSNKLSRSGTIVNSAITTSSSSGAESSTENKKPAKKTAKKKHNKEGNLMATTAESETSSEVAVKKSLNEKSLAAKSVVNHTTQKISKTESSSSALTSSKSNNASSSEKNPLRRLQKLSSVSNFFIVHQQDANSDEQIFVESSESSGGDADHNVKQSNSISENFEKKTSPTKNDSLTNYTNSQTTQEISCEKTKNSNKTKSSTGSKSKTNSSSCCLDAGRINKMSPRMTPKETQSESLTSYTTTTATTGSITDQEEPSWWQDTSRQIDTVSALDYNNVEDMRFKVRHIESGEKDWWLRNDEDDTLADDDLKTLNQQGDDDDDDEATDPLNSLPTTQSGNDKSAITKGDWWTNAATDETDEITKPSDVEYKPNFYCEDKEETKTFPQSQVGSETECWDNNGKTIKQPPERKDSLQLKIRNSGSGETPWWTTEEISEDAEPNDEITLDTTINVSSKSQSAEASSSNNEPKRWWMAGPIKKLFNLQRVDSEEKAWWQDHSEKNAKSTKPKRNDSDVEEWWLDDNEKEEKQQKQQDDIPVISESDNNHQSYNNDANDINVELSSSFNFQYSERPPPVGQCASPIEYGEDNQQLHSLYTNIPMAKVQTIDNQQSRTVAKAPHNVNNKQNYENSRKLFISRHQNIDELLGGSCRPLSPLFLDGSNFGVMPIQRNMFLEEITPDQVRIHDSTAQMPVIQIMERDECERDPQVARTVTKTLAKPYYEQETIDDAALQVYKDGDYGAYLDLESSLAEQVEEIEGLHSSRKNSVVVRTQLSVRVHAIIEKLLSAEGSNLRRALFSLKQVFQEDKDLVHAFVALGGLNCLVRVGNGADQNYQNYILRALGQVMLYVDGMNGVIKHAPTMQWLYSLIASNYRSVVKTALKLLLVFVEYAESNCHILVNAIQSVDKQRGTLPWSNIMRLLKDYDNADAELIIYAASLINKTLEGLNDQDSFYDESDLLEQQGMESVIQYYMSRPDTDLDLINQLQLYEAVLKFEDGETDGTRLPDNALRKTQRFRSSTDTAERRKSRRHSTGTSIGSGNCVGTTKAIPAPLRLTFTQPALDEDSSSSTNSNDVVFTDKKPRDGAGVTPGLRRRRERAERHKSFLKEQESVAAAAAGNSFLGALEKRSEELESDNEDKKLLLQLKRDHTVKDLTQKLSNLPTSPSQEDKQQQSRMIGDMSGLITKAKECLAKSKNKGEMSRSSSVDQELKKLELKKSENDLQWEELVRNMSRPLHLCDLDFTDLTSEDEKDILAPRGNGHGVPPPPPPLAGTTLPPPMLPTHFVYPPSMNYANMSISNTSIGSSNCSAIPPPVFSYSGYGNQSLTNSVNSSINGSINEEANSFNTVKKNKKTVKLFWKEVREDLIPMAVGKTIWDELPTANIDIQKLEHLFESRAKDLMTKKQQEMNKSKEIIVLDHKRSNAINIAMTKLPPPRAIKAAILKMDPTVVTREGIDKLLNMLPTDEERGKIQEAQMANPELPLGSAEQFLLTLASISELAARLKLWAFRLDFDNNEKEIAEPLMDLKHGIEILRHNRTFKCILSTLLSVGIFLNGASVKGFQIEYLAKVPEVKDTVHKHSLLHHLCHMVMESCAETTDLYSEIGPITRASKADFTELAYNLGQMEHECKSSWDRLKLIAKHDCPPQLKQKLVDFLADCAERIILLQIVHRRVMNRYRKFLLWLGVPQHSVAESKPNEFCRIVSEFALEYRTTRERVQQQLEKKANHRERNKTRGKLIVDITKFKTKEDKQDAELKELLGTPSSDTADGTLTWRRRRAEALKSPINRQNEENFTDGDDEILESLVKTATKAPGSRTTPRERKRTRHADRKSLKRSRTREGFTVEKAPSP